jgi:hypothetical protein
MSSFIQKVKYAIDDIHLSITDIFLYSTRFGKLIHNSHDSAYEFIHGYGKEVCEKYDLSTIYTLSAIYTMDYDEQWQHILSKSQYNLFEENGEYILGYIVVPHVFTPNSGGGRAGLYNNIIHFIDYMDTRLRGYKLGAFMIKLYESMFPCDETNGVHGCIACFPYKINDKTVVYWRKYFEKHNVFTREDLQFVIKEYGIFGKIEWDLLLHEYSVYNTTIWRK